ncbi:pantoate--beta-alanine ligase [Paenibacillus sp. GCM10012307]|uniref:Pantothenate synthetase n=1 Tax=Paenibacillus roseus TaxID=2798579 RepID=A0A934MQV4_9BACL|nr:pantoate--beta-alanine ligase [Paenibacillus roseus]MBJ6363566.1 pantoate--beta-alanine ligase [Paenibacillus roseus]
MIICTTIFEVKEAVAEYRRGDQDGIVGFVPTMGFLHEGHASLMRRSRAECGLTVLSIFVNPLQFGPNEDFDRYPRNAERDIELASKEQVDIVFMPAVREMYPKPVKTTVLVSDLTDRLCGASRPGHFDGVGTVVSKLFHIVAPDKAYFGLKDAQQVAVIAKMTEDLNFPVEIVPCETVREGDGLALSSRNVYLNEDERAQAVVLYRALNMASELSQSESMTPANLRDKLNQYIKEDAPLSNIDYIQVLGYPDLAELDSRTPLKELRDSWIVAMAVKFGSTRLIDNRLFPGEEVASHV